MKKITSLLLILLFSSAMLLTGFAAESSEETLSYVVVTDEAEKLIGMTELDYESLLDRAEDIASEYEFGVYLILVTDYKNNFGESSIADMSDSVIDYYNLGYGNNGGILLLIDCELREYDIYSWGKYGADYFPDGCVSDIEDQFLPDLKKSDWLEAGESYLKACEKRLKTYDPYDDPYEGTNWDEKGYSAPHTFKNYYFPRIAVVTIVSLLAAWITCSVMKKQMKSAELKTNADDYIPNQGIVFTVKRDLFTHTTETRTKIESSSGTRSGGGGGGGSSHHSGRF